MGMENTSSRRDFVVSMQVIPCSFAGQGDQCVVWNKENTGTVCNGHTWKRVQQTGEEAALVKTLNLQSYIVFSRI